jgi:hypothetical protein
MMVLCMNVNDLIKELQSISENKRKMPVVVVCPNGLEVEPKIKLGMKDNLLFGEVNRIVVTW